MSRVEIFCIVAAVLLFAEAIRRTGADPELARQSWSLEEMLTLQSMVLTSIALFFVVASRALRGIA